MNATDYKRFYCAVVVETLGGICTQLADDSDECVREALSWLKQCEREQATNKEI